MMQPGDISRAELIMRLRSRGFSDVRLLRAIEQVPRDRFLPRRFADVAYEDRLIPLPCGQTSNSISEATLLVEAARLDEAHTVLEIGTGSGYLTAILANLASRVFSIERYRRLVDMATESLLDIGADNVTLSHGDGLIGLSEHAPFDRIVVGGGCQSPPQALMDQLKEGGEMIVAVGARGSSQLLTRFIRAGAHVERMEIASIRLAPLVNGRSQQI